MKETLQICRYGFQPQRAAVLIYWQALKLLWMGAPFYSPPDASFHSEVAENAKHTKLASKEAYQWTGAASFPWNVDQ